MASLRSFSGSALPGDTSLSETSGVRICSLPQKYITDCGNIQSYPEIHNLSKEIFNSHISRQDHLILPVQEPFLKQFARTFFDEGFKSSLKFLKDSQLSIFSPLSGGILKVMNYGNRVRMFFNPHLKEIGIENYDNFSQVRQWKNSAVRYLTFHPQFFKIAIASGDDTIRIYTNDENSVIPLLKHGQQKSIFCLAWRPYSLTLAVGCQSGFLVWTIDPNSNITRPLSQAVHFRHENHFPVTSLEFNHNGTLLATASFNDNSILIWDIDKNQCTPLRKASVPFLNLQWNVDGSFIFSSTVGNIFRLFNCETWNSEKWSTSNGHVQSFQWSPCGKFLLFVTSEDPVLYCLGFADEPLLFNKSKTEIQQPQRALPVADLSEICIENYEAGGVAQQIAWNGKYLAISFKNTNSIAIFQTTVRQHHLHILPMFFVCGLGAEFPSFISFQPNYKKNVAFNCVENVLTIAWSSGRIQFHPFI